MGTCSLRDLPPTPDLVGTEWDAIDKRDVLAYDADKETYLASFNLNNETACEAILAAVAVVAETPPLELPPLSSVPDADTLERLIRSAGTGPPSGDVHVSFTYADCSVTVSSFGIIAVRPLEEAPLA